MRTFRSSIFPDFLDYSPKFSPIRYIYFFPFCVWRKLDNFTTWYPPLPALFWVVRLVPGLLQLVTCNMVIAREYTIVKNKFTVCLFAFICMLLLQLLSLWIS